MNNATASSIQNLTLAYFGRPADPASLIGWPASKLTLNQIVQIYVNTAEYRLITFDPNSVLNATGGRTVNDTTLINTFYVRLFGRDAAAVEVAGWTNALATGAVNYDFLGITMLNAGLNLPTTGEAGAMRAVLQAKIDSSSAYTTAIATTPGAAVAYSTAIAIQDGITYNLSTTTSTAKTTAQATAAVVTMTAGSNANAGQTFTLTTNVDTASASRFVGDVAIVGAFAINTLNNGDRLTGSGTDTSLNVTINEAGGPTISPATLQNINNLNASFSAIGAVSAATTLDFSVATGLANVTWSNAGSANLLTNLSSALANLSVSNTAADQTFTFVNAALSGASDALNLNLNGVTGAVGAITLNTAGTTTASTSNYEIVNISSNGGTTNVVSIAQNGKGLTTLNVTGSAGLTLVNASANLTAFNASTATGAISYTAGTEGAAAYTGGSGGDSFTLAATYTTADTINGGLGTDTLAITSALASATVNQANISSIENLRITDNPAAAATYTPGFYGGATTLSLNAAQTGAITVEAAAGTTGVLDLRTFTSAAATTINVAGTAVTDAYTINASSAAAANIFGAALAVNGAETVTINNNGAGTATLQNTVILTQSIGGSSTLNLNGVNGIAIQGNTTVSIINANGITVGGLLMATAGGATTVSQVATNITGSSLGDRLGGSANSDVISGGAGADIINGNGGADSITLGSGFDTVNFNADATAGNAGLLNSASYSIVTDFVTGTTTTTTDFFTLSSDANYGAAALEDFAGTDIAATNAVSVLTTSRNQATTGATSTANLLKITNTDLTTSALNAQQGFAAAIGTGVVTTAGLGTFATVYYDATNSQAVLGVVSSTGANIDSADTFAVLTRVTMNATDFGNFGATNFRAFAANAAL